MLCVFLSGLCGKKNYLHFTLTSFGIAPLLKIGDIPPKNRAMKQMLLFFAGVCVFSCVRSQNVGIGTTTPTTKLHVVGASPNIATFSGGDMMYITLAEGINNRGYIGSYAGNAEDVDFGTDRKSVV